MTSSYIKKKDGEKKIIYNARFVKENFGDRHKVYANEHFIKSWTFRNNGEHEWPLDTLFIQTNGDNLEGSTQIVEGPVKPGDEITIQISMVAPQLAGKYCAFFRFVHGDNQRFGQKVWCDILVEEVLIQQIPAAEMSSLIDLSEQKGSSILEFFEQPVVPQSNFFDLINNVDVQMN